MFCVPIPSSKEEFNFFFERFSCSITSKYFLYCQLSEKFLSKIKRIPAHHIISFNLNFISLVVLYIFLVDLMQSKILGKSVHGTSTIKLCEQHLCCFWDFLAKKNNIIATYNIQNIINLKIYVSLW